MFSFTPLAGVLFTFPSRYCFAIGHTGVFSLTRWSSLIHTGFHVPRATRDSAEQFLLLTTGLSPSLVQDSAASSSFLYLLWLSHYPIRLSRWFRLVPVRSPLLGESLLLSFPRATKMFQFARLTRVRLWIERTVLGVAPFGNLRLIACFQLPGAYRRSLRPSSPLCA